MVEVGGGVGLALGLRWVSCSEGGHQFVGCAGRRRASRDRTRAGPHTLVLAQMRESVSVRVAVRVFHWNWNF